MTEAALVLRAQQGDAAAFEQLVRRYRDAVYGYAYQRTLDFAAAEELAQEALVRAYLRLGTLRDPHAFGAWLFRLTANLCAGRARAARPTASLDDAEVASPDDTADRTALRDLVRRALATLPEGNRATVVLYYINGYTCRELAELLGVRETTVRGRLKRGRDQLRREMLGMDQLRGTLGEHALGDEFLGRTLREAVRRAEAALRADQFGAVVGIVDEGLAAAGEQPPGSVRRALSDLYHLRGRARSWDTRLGDGREDLRRSIELLPETDPQALVERYSHLGWAHNQMRDPLGALEAADQQLRWARQAGDEEAVAFALAGKASTALNGVATGARSLTGDDIGLVREAAELAERLHGSPTAQFAELWAHMDAVPHYAFCLWLSERLRVGQAGAAYDRCGGRGWILSSHRTPPTDWDLLNENTLWSLAWPRLLVPASPAVGQSWTERRKEWGMRFESTATIVSLGAQVSTPAGDASATRLGPVWCGTSATGRTGCRGRWSWYPARCRAPPTPTFPRWPAPGGSTTGRPWAPPGGEA